MKYTRSDIAKGFVTQADKRGTGVAIKELAALLLEQNLHGQLDEIIDDIANEYTKRHGFLEAEVRTAFTLSAALKAEVVERIKHETNAQKVILHEQIDRSLLGGVVITAPDMELDLSLKTKLAKLKA